MVCSRVADGFMITPLQRATVLPADVDFGQDQAAGHEQHQDRQDRYPCAARRQRDPPHHHRPQHGRKLAEEIVETKKLGRLTGRDEALVERATQRLHAPLHEADNDGYAVKLPYGFDKVGPDGCADVEGNTYKETAARANAVAYKGKGDGRGETDKLRDEQMDPLMAKQAAVNGLTDEWLDAHQISYDLRRKYANEIQASNALNLPSKKDQEKAVRNLIRNDASPAPDGTTAPLVNLIEADLVNMWRTKTREYIQEGANPAEASERAVKFVMAHFEANSGKDNPTGLYYKNPNKASEYTNYKNELGKRGVKAENVTQRYHNLERLLKVYDGDFNDLIKSGQLFSKPDLEKINTIMERDPFLLSIDKNSPLFVRVQQAKALLTRNNPNLSFPKLLERTYDLMDMPVPPALQEIGPKLEQLTPSQNRFLNKLFVTGDVSQNQISRAITPVSSVPLRPGKEYALAQTGMAGLRGLTRSGEGGYTSMFPSEAYPQMTNMTIRELVAFQKEKLRDGRKSAAVGAYQFLYPEVAAKRAGLSLDDKFTPENQDKMFDATLMQKRKAINNYLTGKSDDIEAALDELSMEFASFEYRGGRSYYNDGINKARI